MSNFPATLDDDTTLYVARDNISTKLSASQSITDNVAVVASGAGWAPNMIASIGTEQEFVLGVAGNLLAVARNFGGTVATAHAAGSLVSNNVDAAYQSSAKSAIIAIETALGVNLSNVQTAPIKYSNLYNFAPVTPGGALAVGANTITFPLPPGITANSVGSAQLYISGGVGSAEVVPVIGVAAGAVTVTCLNTHSGAWTIQSATSGVQEAVIATGGAGRVQMPPGDVVFQSSSGASTITGCVTIPGSFQISLRGLGKGVTEIRCNGLTGDRIWFNRPLYVDLGDFSIRNAAVTFHTADSMIRVSYAVYGTINNIEIENAYRGLTMEACLGGITVTNLIIGVRAIGIYVTTLGVVNPSSQNGFDISFCRISLIGNGSGGACFLIEDQTVGMTLTSCSATAVGGDLTNTRCLEILISSTTGATNEISIIGGIYDAAAVAIMVQGDNVAYNNNWIIFSGVECAGYEFGFVGLNKVQNIHWTGGLIKSAGGTTQQGMSLQNVKNARFSDVDLECLGAAGITLDLVMDILLDSVVIGKNASTPTSALVFNGTAVRTVIQNCDFGACTNKIPNPITAANPLKIVNNVGVDDVIPTIPSSGTIVQPVNPSAYITGIATITTMTSFSVAGTRVRLIKKDGGSLTVGGGGNIPGTHTMAQNTSLDLEWDGSSWF